MEYTTAQLKAGLSNAKAEYKIAKSLQAQYPSDENLQHCKATYARIDRINAMIEAQPMRFKMSYGPDGDVRMSRTN